jgi:hypothetical protein
MISAGLRMPTDAQGFRRAQIKPHSIDVMSATGNTARPFLRRRSSIQHAGVVLRFREKTHKADGLQGVRSTRA